MRDTNTEVPKSFAISQVRAEYKKEYLPNPETKRQTFQERLAQARAAEGKTSIFKEIKRMKRVEAQRHSARRI